MRVRIENETIIGRTRCLVPSRNLDGGEAAVYLKQEGRVILDFKAISKVPPDECVECYRAFAGSAAGRTAIIAEGVDVDLEALIGHALTLRNGGAAEVYVLSRRVHFLDTHICQIMAAPINVFFLASPPQGREPNYKLWPL